jgi:hypothetical protein
MAIKIIPDPKDPTEHLDYQIDWTDALAGDIVASSKWSVLSGDGVISDASVFGPTSTTVWVDGGTIGVPIILENAITTIGQRTEVQSIKINVKER